MLSFKRGLHLTAYFTVFLVVTIGLARAQNLEVGAVLKEAFQTGHIETGSQDLDERVGELRDYYATRKFKPLWVRDTGPKGKAKALLVELNRSVVHGLSPGYYRVDELETLMNAKEPKDLARLEMLFSGAWYDYAHDLSNGRIGWKQAPDQVQIEPVVHSVRFLIDGAEKTGNLREFASSLLNVDDRYVRLLSKIAELKRSQTAGLWPKISADLPSMSIGDENSAIPDIKKYLLLNGDFLAEAYSQSAIFDQALRQALIAFQSRNGLSQTGDLDGPTLQVMSQPVSFVIDTISINLERRRWQNKEIGSTHFYFNLADGSARFVVNGEKFAEYEVLNAASYRDVPSVFGQVTRIDRISNSDKIMLVFRPDFSRDTQASDWRIELSGSAEEIQKALGLSDEFVSEDGKTLSLPQGINAFATYLTAWANKDGSVHFRRDVAHKDDKLFGLLSRR